jgi:hypothetical protein
VTGGVSKTNTIASGFKSTCKPAQIPGEDPQNTEITTSSLFSIVPLNAYRAQLWIYPLLSLEAPNLHLGGVFVQYLDEISPRSPLTNT